MNNSIFVGKDFLRSSALVVLVIFFWLLFRSFEVEFLVSYPLEYGEKPNTVDTKFTLAAIKAAEQGSFNPFQTKNQPRLGAPHGAEWDDLLTPDQFIVYTAGLYASILGVFGGANLAVLIGQILAGITLYWVLRSLRCDWVWAFLFGILFSFSTMASARSIHHLVILYYWHVPLCLLVCVWVIRDELLSDNRTKIVAIFTAIVTGIQNPYYTAFFLQLLGIAMVVALFRRDYRNAIGSIGIATITMAAFFVMSLGHMAYNWEHGKNTFAWFRSYRWLEMFALKPVELFLPPPWHPVDWITRILQEYRQSIFVPSELPPSNYLGIIGISGFILVFYVVGRKLILNKKDPVPLEFYGILYTLAFSVVGGLNSILGIMGFQMLRSSNRFSIFILAMVYFFLAKFLSQNRFFQKNKFAIAIVLLCIGLYDQSPPPLGIKERQEIMKLVDADREFAKELENEFGKGDAVCQLPYCPFPEANFQGIQDYEHFTFFILTEDVRFSFGNVKGRKQDDWINSLNNKSVPDVVDMIKSKGFSGMLIYRPAFGESSEAIVENIRMASGGKRKDHALGTYSLISFN